MARRLTLSQVGIKSPLDVANTAVAGGPAPDVITPDVIAPDVIPPDAIPPASQAEPEPRAKRRPALRQVADRPSHPQRTSSAGQLATVSSAHDVDQARFFGAGRPVQTSIALDDDCAQLLDELARAASVAVNPLAVAVLHAGLPADTETAREAIIEERVRRAGVSAARIERNLRLPGHLRARIDELVAGARERSARINRADLINAALRRGLPDDAAAAAELATQYRQRVERAA
jgi:Arc/MetJ-type ribon-helix-helix transcriptional regulator